MGTGVAENDSGCDPMRWLIQSRDVHTLPSSALARNFWTALSLSSLSSGAGADGAGVAAAAGVWGWRCLSWGEGVVPDDEGVAIGFFDACYRC